MSYAFVTSGTAPLLLKINGTTLDVVALSAVTIPICPAAVLPVSAPIAIPVLAAVFSPGASRKLV